MVIFPAIGSPLPVPIVNPNVVVLIPPLARIGPVKDAPDAAPNANVLALIAIAREVLPIVTVLPTAILVPILTDPVVPAVAIFRAPPEVIASKLLLLAILIIPLNCVSLATVIAPAPTASVSPVPPIVIVCAVAPVPILIAVVAEVVPIFKVPVFP